VEVEPLSAAAELGAAALAAAEQVSVVGVVAALAEVELLSAVVEQV
jgi:hypothetical protein